MIEISNKELGRPEHILAPGYVSGDLVFSSGSVGTDYSTNTLPASVEEQTVFAIENLKAVLEKGGSSLNHVLKVLLFIKNREDAPKVNKIYAKYFPHRPARSCIMVNFPNDNIKVELECIAKIPRESKL